jgi:hypothetical protein
MGLETVNMAIVQEIVLDKGVVPLRMCVCHNNSPTPDPCVLVASNGMYEIHAHSFQAFALQYLPQLLRFHLFVYSLRFNSLVDSSTTGIYVLKSAVDVQDYMVTLLRATQLPIGCQNVDMHQAHMHLAKQYLTEVLTAFPLFSSFLLIGLSLLVGVHFSSK